MPEKVLNSFSTKWFERWKNVTKVKSQLPPAYLLVGSQGADYQPLAEAMAQELVGALENNPNYLSIQPEKSIKVEDIRVMIQRIQLKPVQGNSIVIFIQEADTMTEGAANALLKTLEEPPSYALFLLGTRFPDELLATIRSRCQKVSLVESAEDRKRRYQEESREWQPVFESMAPLFEGGAQPVTQAYKAAEQWVQLGKSGSSLAQGLHLLRALLHEALMIQNAPGQDHPGVLVFENHFPWSTWASRLASRKTSSLLTFMDCIEETELAIEGNVNKTLALERLLSHFH